MIRSPRIKNQEVQMIKIYISLILPSQHVAYNKVELSEEYSGACWRELSSISDSRATVCTSACWGSVMLYLAPYLPDVSLSTSSAGTATCSGENCRNWERFILVRSLTNDHCSDILPSSSPPADPPSCVTDLYYLVTGGDVPSDPSRCWRLHYITFSAVATKPLCHW